VRIDAKPLSRPLLKGELADLVAEAVEQPHRVLGILHADMYVDRHRRLAASERPHGVGDRAVAASARHADLALDRQRVRARRGSHETHGAQLAGELGPQPAQLPGDAGHVEVHAGPEFDHGGVGFRRSMLAQLARQARQHPLARLAE
jgi:hypothetical protein